MLQSSIKALIQAEAALQVGGDISKRKVRRLIPKRERPWPDCVAFIESEWDEHSDSEGFCSFWGVRYFVELSPGCKFENGINEVFESSERLVNYLSMQVEEYKKVVCIGRNMSQICTLMEVSKRFRAAGFKCSWYFVGNGRMYIRLDRGTDSITFCDIGNWLPGEIDVIGKWAGVMVEKINRFWPDEHRPPHYHMHVLNAVSAGFYKYRRWVENNNVGGFTFSLSSLAFTYFSRMDESRKLIHPRSEWLGAVEKKAHFGGFCMAHKIGAMRGDTFYLLDCNGLYGGVLRDESLPYRHVTSNFTPRDGDIERAESRGDYLVQGVFELSNGFLPVRQGRKVNWSHDITECCLPGPEFRWCREHGKVLQIDAIHLYDMYPIGKEVSDIFLAGKKEARKRGDFYEARLFKLLHNSLYGKFSQRFGEIHTFPIEDGEVDGEEYCIDYKSGSVWKVIIFCGSKIIQTEDGFGDTFFPSISAFITSYARVRLWNLCSQAGWENVFYNDTDSLLVNRAGYKRLEDQIDQNATGKLKVEDVGDGCEILGEKRYSIGLTRKDGTEPNNYRVSEDGFVIWAEKQSLIDKHKRSEGAVMTRMRHKRTWANDVKAWADEELGRYDKNNT